MNDSELEKIGIVSIAVEDDHLFMSHSTYDKTILTSQKLKTAPIPIGKPFVILEFRSPINPDSEADDFREVKLRLNKDIIKTKIEGFLNEVLSKNLPLHGIGISIFGNIDPDRKIMRYLISSGDNHGEFVEIDFLLLVRNVLQDRFSEVVVCVDNDATAAAFGEAKYGAGKSDSGCLSYIWLGRGTNAGIILRYPDRNSKSEVIYEPWRGQMHCEIGHMMPRFHEDDFKFIEWSKIDPEPKCAEHKNCLLALTSLRALKDRQTIFKMEQEKLEEIYSYYVAQLCISLTLTLAPSKIVVGGYGLERISTMGITNQNVQFLMQISY